MYSSVATYVSMSLMFDQHVATVAAFSVLSTYFVYRLMSNSAGY